MIATFFFNILAIRHPLASNFCRKIRHPLNSGSVLTPVLEGDAGVPSRVPTRWALWRNRHVQKKNRSQPNTHNNPAWHTRAMLTRGAQTLRQVRAHESKRCRRSPEKDGLWTDLATSERYISIIKKESNVMSK